MKEWKIYKLSEVLEIKYGKDHKHLNDGDVPLYGSGGIMRYVDTPLYDQESILIPRKGTLSNLFYVNTPFWSVDTMFYTKIKKGNNGKYLYYLLKSMDLASMNVGSAVPSLTTEVLNKIKINIPNETEQSQIEQILSSLDNKIELNLKMNQTIEAMAQSIFKEWFVDFKFPDFDGQLVDGLPKGWRYKTISELGRVVTGNTPSSKNPEYFGSVTPFITPTDFKNYGKLIIGANRLLSLEGKIAMRTRLLPKDSIIVTCIGSDMGKIALNKVECVTNQQINSIIPNNKLFVDYLYYNLTFKYDYLRNIATGGSTMPIINKSKFEEIELLIPDEGTLKDFQSIMNSFNYKIEMNIKQMETLIATRDALLPNIMSGKIEIKN